MTSEFTLAAMFVATLDAWVRFSLLVYGIKMTRRIASDIFRDRTKPLNPRPSHGRVVRDSMLIGLVLCAVFWLVFSIVKPSA